jgi:hypothetical protein
MLWAQAGAVPPRVVVGRVPDWLQWLYLWGDPSYTDARFFGGLIVWAKIVGLFCLLGWLGSWVLAGAKARSLAPVGRKGLLTLGVALVLGLATVVLDVLDRTGRLKLMSVGGLPLRIVPGLVGGLVVFGWVEWLLWALIFRLGKAADRAVLIGLHVALGLGVAVGYLIQATAGALPNWSLAATSGARLGATYMGLVVLARVAALLTREVVAVRWRRLYGIAWHTWVEAFRRMWAPWVVLVVFLVILAFTDWFLRPDPGRVAEMGRLYTGTLMLLSSILLTVMVAILAPISLPQDIQQQTIYTVVSKPVRRIELIWGRMLGFMSLVTVVLLVFGGISLAYLERTVGKTITSARDTARKAASEGKEAFAKQFNDQADQLETRMSARVPIKGVLTFVDSRGHARNVGIDVGQELEGRSFIEGATPSMAIWSFGVVPNPRFRRGDPRPYLDQRIPVDRLLRAGTIEERQNRLAELGDQFSAARERQQSAQKQSDASASSAEMKRLNDEVAAVRADVDRLLARERDLRKQAAGKGQAEAGPLLAEAEALHSPPIPLEMNFNIYRTTKGEIGEPVHASLVVRNPRPNVAPHRDFLPIHEYYTDKRLIPSRVLVGSNGYLRVEVQCFSPNQYLGMSESDLYLLARQGRFWDNYLRGLFGVWLQAMVLVAIGVFAGSFLSWPVALVTTLAFFVAGQAAFTFLQQIAILSDRIQGGGPFEALIRLLAHDNLQTELAPTLSVVIAKSADALAIPIMSRLVYLVPNFAAMDVSNTVADGFAVTWAQAFWGLLLALGYALPFSVAGYFILKNREVAA